MAESIPSGGALEACDAGLRREGLDCEGFLVEKVQETDTLIDLLRSIEPPRLDFCQQCVWCAITPTSQKVNAGKGWRGRS